MRVLIYLYLRSNFTTLSHFYLLTFCYQVKIWFQNRRTKWKKKDRISNGEVAEFRNQGKSCNEKKQQQQQHTTPEETSKLNQPLQSYQDLNPSIITHTQSTGFKRNTTKILCEKIKNSKHVQPVSQNIMPKIRKNNNLETTDDIETKIIISKITNKLLNTAINEDSGRVTVKSMNPEISNIESSSKDNIDV